MSSNSLRESGLKDVDLQYDAPSIRVEQEGPQEAAPAPAPTGLLLTSAGTRHFHEKNGANYDFYRCAACRRIFTRDWERAAYASMRPGHVRICSCGSKRYNPAWPAVARLRWLLGFVPRPFKWLGENEWLDGAVIRYSARCVLAREVAPRLVSHPRLFALVDLVLRRTEPVDA